MSHSPFFRLAGWCAFISAAATVVGFVTLILFFSVGGPFGLINDLSSILGALVLLPILLALYRLVRAANPRAAFAAYGAGTGAMLFAALWQTLFVLRVIPLSATLASVPIAFGVLGLCIAVDSWLAQRIAAMPSKLAWLGIASGVAYVVVIAGFIVGGQNHPLTIVAGLAAVILNPIFMIGLGRLWARR